MNIALTLAAALSLGLLADHRFSQPLREITLGADRKAAELAVRALGWTGRMSEGDFLVSIAADSELPERLRIAAVAALDFLCFGRAIGALDQIAETESSLRLRSAAARAVKHIRSLRNPSSQ